MAAYEEQEYKKPFSFQVWAKMLPFFKPYKKYFVITIGLNLLLAGIDVLVPLFQSYAIDHFIVPDTLDACKDRNSIQSIRHNKMVNGVALKQWHQHINTGQQ